MIKSLLLLQLYWPLNSWSDSAKAKWNSACCQDRVCKLRWRRFLPLIAFSCKFSSFWDQEFNSFVSIRTRWCVVVQLEMGRCFSFNGLKLKDWKEMQLKLWSNIHPYFKASRVCSEWNDNWTKRNFLLLHKNPFIITDLNHLSSNIFKEWRLTSDLY